MSKSHALRRTSPKGGPFIGTCMKCGLDNIPVDQMHAECANPASFTDSEILLRAIKGHPDE